MDNKKRNILILSIAAIILVAAIIIIIIKSNNKEASFTRHEWIEMLADDFYMNEYSNSTPYFKDVTSDEPYFAAVQTAYEWGVLGDTSKFDGNKAVSGEYAAITALKAAGQYRIKIYLGLSDLPSDDDYIKLALDKGMITDDQLKNNLSQEEAVAVLERSKEFYLSDLWIDDYVDIKYTDGVAVLTDDQIESYDAETGSLYVKNVSDIDSGSVIVFADEYTGGKIAKRVKKVTSDGTLTLEDVVLDDVIEHFIMSDIISMSAEDIIQNTAYTNGNSDVIKTGFTDDFSFHFNKPVHNSGVNFDIAVANNEAKISYKNNDNGTSGSVTVPNINIENSDSNASGDSSFNCSFNLTKFDIGVMTDIGMKDNQLVVNNIETQLDTELDVLYEVGGSIETEIPLMKVPIYGEEKLAGIELEIKLIISMDGTISLETSYPVHALFEYRKGAQPRFNAGVEGKIKEVRINCGFEGKFRIEPSIFVLGIRITDVELDVGGGASADFIPRSNSDVTACADINFYAPTLELGWNNDDKSLLGDYINASLTILDADNAPFKKCFHFEWYSNKPGQFVDVCTFGETGQRSEEDVDLDYSIPHQYYGEIHSEFKKKDGHLEATGKLISLALVSEDDFKSAALGKSIECNGVNFTITKAGQDRDTNKKWFVLDNKYFIKEGNEDGGYSMAAGQEANKTYYRIETLSQDSLAELDDEEYFFPNGDKRVFIVIDDNFTFKTGDYYGGDVPKPSKGTWYYIQFSDGSSINDPNDVGRIYGFEEDTYGAVTDEGVIIEP